jgi:hypothetical protein
MFKEFQYINEAKDIKRIRGLVIIGFLFFFGLRGFILSDWINYYSLFADIPSLIHSNFLTLYQHQYIEEYGTDISQGTAGIEIGFIYFTSILKTFFPNYHLWILVNSIIDVILLDIFFRRYSKYYTLGFIFFFVFYGVTIECNLMRNVKAILLFLLSLKYLQERKIIPYMLLNIVGYLFHSSAIIFFPLYFLLHKKISVKILWTIFIIGNFIYLTQIKFISPILIGLSNYMGDRMSILISLYLGSDSNQSHGITIGYLERIISFIIIMKFRKKLFENSVNNIMFFNLFVLYFISNFFFYEISVAIERLTLLFVSAYWILYPAVISLINNIKLRLFFIIALIAYSSLKIVLIYSNIVSRYDNLLFGIESYEVRKGILENNLDDIINKK